MFDKPSIVSNVQETTKQNIIPTSTNALKLDNNINLISNTKAQKILDLNNFSKKYDVDILHYSEQMFNQQSMEQFINRMLLDDTQIGLLKEIEVEKMFQDKSSLKNNLTNTTLFPLAHYHNETRNFNINWDSLFGGFMIERNLNSINMYKNINLQPTTAYDPALDKQRTRKYTKFAFSIFSTLTDQSRVHFINETLCYTMYQYLFKEQGLSDGFRHRNVSLYFADHMYELGEHPQEAGSYVINSSDKIEICHAIRAILLTNSKYNLSKESNIMIYVPIMYEQDFDYHSGRQFNSRIINLTADILFKTVTSLLNGVIPKIGLPANAAEHLDARPQINFVLTPPTSRYSFTVDIQDLHATLSILSRSFGVMYFNGRCYNGNFEQCSNESRKGSSVTVVRSDLKNRLAFVHKMLNYANDLPIQMFSSSRLNNKLIWYTRCRFIQISCYIKRFIGSLANSKIREEMVSDYKYYLNILEILGDNYVDVKLSTPNLDTNINLISCSYCPIAVNCDLSRPTAYTKFEEINNQDQFNKCKAWFGDQQQRCEDNSPNIPITDTIIDHNYIANNEGNPTEDVLLLIEYCNPVCNWNSNVFGNLILPPEVLKFHAEINAAKKWSFSDRYYLENGLKGSYNVYGRSGDYHAQIYCYNNSRNFDCVDYCLPYIFEFDDNKDYIVECDFKIYHQRYINDNGDDLYHPKYQIVKGDYCMVKRRNFRY